MPGDEILARISLVAVLALEWLLAGVDSFVSRAVFGALEVAVTGTTTVGPSTVVEGFLGAGRRVAGFVVVGS